MSRGKGHELGELVAGTGRGTTRLSQETGDSRREWGTATAPHDEDVNRGKIEEVSFAESAQAVKILYGSMCISCGQSGSRAADLSVRITQTRYL